MQDSEEYPALITLDNEAKIITYHSKSDYIPKSDIYTDVSIQDLLVSQTSISLQLYQAELSKIKELKKPSEDELKNNFVFVGPKRNPNIKHTLIFDLDHTLIYTEIIKSDLELDSSYHLQVNVRPHAIELLKEMSLLYEILVFTAASEDYAKICTSILDPEGKLIKKVLTRKNCFETREGYIVKDLRILRDRNINDILIIDDSIYSYAFNIENGIPIKEYEGDSEDVELKVVEKYLKNLWEEKPENLASANKGKLWMGL